MPLRHSTIARSCNKETSWQQERMDDTCFLDSIHEKNLAIDIDVHERNFGPNDYGEDPKAA